MTPKQIELARHALGLKEGRTVSYRNHFVTDECPGNQDHAEWMQMVARGDAIRRKGNPITGGMDCFYLTRGGAEAALKPNEQLDPEDFPDRPPQIVCCACGKGPVIKMAPPVCVACDPETKLRPVHV